MTWYKIKLMRQKKICLFMFALWFISPAISQETIAFRQKVSLDKVPQVVALHFQEQHKNVHTIGWYATHITYWYDDTFNHWYEGWYDNRKVTIYTFQQPSYYEVEFIDEPGELSRALYSRYGAWFETRTKIKGLPPHINSALQQTKYKDWKRSNHMEKIDVPEMHGFVYRLKVSKGMKSQIIRIDDQGKLIQIKEEFPQ